jgi:hypothetical protein
LGAIDNRYKKKVLERHLEIVDSITDLCSDELYNNNNKDQKVNTMVEGCSIVVVRWTVLISTIVLRKHVKYFLSAIDPCQ